MRPLKPKTMIHRRYFNGIYGDSQMRLLKTFHEHMGRIMASDYGKDRRALFKALYKEIPSLELFINIEGCLHTKYDPDLRRLLKEGFLKRERRKYGWGQSTSAVLVKA